MASVNGLLKPNSYDIWVKTINNTEIPQPIPPPLPGPSGDTGPTGPAGTPGNSWVENKLISVVPGPPQSLINLTGLANGFYTVYAIVVAENENTYTLSFQTVQYGFITYDTNVLIATISSMGTQYSSMPNNPLNVSISGNTFDVSVGDVTEYTGWSVLYAVTFVPRVQ